MPCHVIGYDLSKPGQEYKELHGQIRSYGAYLHVMESMWLIRTSDKPVQIRDYLSQFIEDNDKLFVGVLSGEAAWGQLGKQADEWLRKNLDD